MNWMLEIQDFVVVTASAVAMFVDLINWLF